MSYRGDVVLPSFCSVVEIKMPTAILLLYTPGRLVMGADGRKMDRSNPSKGTDSAQKIFGIGNGTNHIAFALAGVAEYTDEQGEILFDFNKEIIAASRELIGKRCKNLYGYATRLSKIVSKRLNDAMEHEKISDLKDHRLSLCLGVQTSLWYS
jgi:ribosomal protein S17E